MKKDRNNAGSKIRGKERDKKKKEIRAKEKKRKVDVKCVHKTRRQGN